MGPARSITLLLVAAYIGGAGADVVEDAFKDFVEKYDKKYASAAEEEARFAIFASNFRIIEAENAKGLPYILGVNGFADQTPDEVMEGRTGLSGKPFSGMKHLGSHRYSGAPLPDAVDWVEKGAVTPVKNQGHCGSCWSFSTTGAIEGAWQIASGKLVSLSEQQLVDCSKENNGCGGGSMEAAFGFLEKHAVCSEESYPYVAKNSACHSDCTDAIPAGGVAGYKDVPADDTNALMEAVAQQPVSIAIEADQMAFQLYKGGILTKKCGAKLDHGVLAVGYGTDNGVEYWKVKNSWGPKWGEEGYVRIERGLPGDGECGIKKDASYPTVTTKPSPVPPTPPAPAPAPPAHSHYEAPPCMSDELEGRIMGGVVCAPKCSASGGCPSDVPAGATGTPACVLKTPDGTQYCALECDGDSDCAKGASCTQGICIYDAARDRDPVEFSKPEAVVV